MHLQSAFHLEELLPHPRAHAVRYHCKPARKPPLMLTARHQHRGSAETGHRLHLARYEGICPHAPQGGDTGQPPEGNRRPRAPEGTTGEMAAAPGAGTPSRPTRGLLRGGRAPPEPPREKGEGRGEKGERRGERRAGPTRGAPPEARRRPREGSAEGGGRGGKWRLGAEGSGALTSARLQLGSAGGRSALLRAEPGPARRSPRPAPAPSFTCRLPRPCPGRREPEWRWKTPPRGRASPGSLRAAAIAARCPPALPGAGHKSQLPAPGLCHPLRAGAPHTEGASQPLGSPADSRVSCTELGPCLEDAKAEGKAARKRSCS